MPRRPGPRTSLATAAMVVFLAGCGQGADDQAADEVGSEDQGASPSTSESGALSGEDHDEAAEGEGGGADTAFVSAMIVHHQGAIELAALAEGRTEREELLDLADRIITVRTAELETLEGMFDRLSGERGDPAEPGAAAEQVPGPSGGTDELAATEGDAFDARFLERMIDHHEAAITSAEEVLAEGQDAEVAALADDMATAQQTEVDQMAGWLERWELDER